MTDTNQPVPRVLDAVVLSLFCTGLGHVYLGRTRRGVLLFFLGLTFVPVFAAASRLPPSALLLGALVASLLFTLLVYLFAVVDAVRIVRGGGARPPRPGWNRPAVYALGVVVGIATPVLGMLELRAHAFEAFRCPTRSMAPNIVAGDRVLVNKTAFSHRAPERGEIVVFRAPGDRNRNYVKRLVGLPGDHVQVVNGRVILNGKITVAGPEGDGPPPMLESVGNRRYRIEIPADAVLPDYETVVPDGRYFLLGDARANSMDSRQFGTVPGEDLLGPVEYVYLPVSRFGEPGAAGDR